ncbi:MAG: response regulator [Chloroflexi bacterium]|nr:response regulator [Chloroflexota bacterium]
MGNHLSILIIEDSENDLRLMLRQLKTDGYDITFERVETAAAMKTALDSRDWDAVISDYMLPQFGGLGALKLFQECQLDIPFIIISGCIGEDDAVAAMKAGAHDYILKDNLKKLAPALERELREAQNRRERKKTEAERMAEHEDRLRAYQRLAHIGKLAGNIAHELRNPLATISSSALYLEKKLGKVDEKTQAHFQRLQSAVDRCDSIIQNLLSEARTPEPHLAREDLRMLTSRVIADSNVPKSVTVIRDFPEAEVPVGADFELLRLAFQNIIKNAVEAMNGAGALTVRIGAGTVATVSFSDTGPGIAPEHLGRVFDPLFTTKATGVGFGLSLATMIIGKHGGTIKAESEYGRGAIFIVQLPLWRDSTTIVEDEVKTR